MSGIINWTTWGTRVKSIIELAEKLEDTQINDADSVLDLREAMFAQFDTEATRSTQAIILGTVETTQRNINLGKTGQANILNAYLRNIATELSLAANEQGIQTIMTRLIDEMNEDSQTVLENSITAVKSADVDNTGDGVLYVSTTDAEGLENEYLIAEKVTLECVEDNAVDNVPLGDEVFQISGLTLRTPNTHLQRGTGSGSTISPITATDTNVLTNGGFNTFDTNVPDGWTIDNGVAGTNIFEDTSSFFEGTASLKYIDVTGSTTIEIHQDIRGAVEGLKKDGLAVRIKTTGMAAGAITITLEGTGFTTQTLVNITSSFPATYTEYQAFANLPDALPDDLKIVLKSTGATAGAVINFDALGLGEATVQGGLSLMLTKGATDWIRGDRLFVTTTNDEAGNIQSYFGRYLGRKLPSSGTPTISDTF